MPIFFVGNFLWTHCGPFVALYSATQCDRLLPGYVRVRIQISSRRNRYVWLQISTCPTSGRLEALHTDRSITHHVDKSAITSQSCSHCCDDHAHGSPCCHTTLVLRVSAPFHCYSIAGGQGRISVQDWAQWKLHNPGAHTRGIWHCASLAQAALHYSWRPFRPAGTPVPFSALARDLQLAMIATNIPGVRRACRNIIEWGGLNSRRAGAALAWIVASGPTLIGKIADATKMLRPSWPGALDRFDGTDLLMDSAMTKTYAAMAMASTGQQEVLMYDARVGAGLCLLVRHYIRGRAPGSTPATLGLDFLCGRENRRNPSQPGIPFRPLWNTAAGHHARAEAARLAARIIQKTLGVATPSWQFAEFEKSLFMIGYDVRQLCCGCLRT